MISLPVVLVVAALMFAIGLYGVLGQTNAVMVIMGVELMLGAAMLNVVGFLRYAHQDSTSGAFFVLILFTMVGGIMVAKQGGRYGVGAPAGEAREG